MAQEARIWIQIRDTKYGYDTIRYDTDIAIRQNLKKQDTNTARICLLKILVVTHKLKNFERPHYNFIMQNTNF